MTCGLPRTLGAAASCSSSAARPQRCAAVVSTRSSCWPSAPSRCCLARQLRCQARIEPYGTDDEWYDIIDTHPSRPLTAQQPSRPGSTAGSRARSAGASPVPALSLEEQVAELRQIVERQQRIINKLLDADSPPSREADLFALYNQLPDRVILIRHAESAGNTNANIYSETPDPDLPLSDKGQAQARAAGVKLRMLLEDDLEQRLPGLPPNSSNNSSTPSQVQAWQQQQQQQAEDTGGGAGGNLLTFMISPYRRSRQTYAGISEAFAPWQLVGVSEQIQIREQDFGNFQDPARMQQDLKDRNKFGRFWFRFPNGESGADVYDRVTLFEDHLTRDMVMGRYRGLNVVLVTHGLTLRIFLMRWFHWSTEQLLQVYNPPNAQPIVLEKVPVSAALQLLRKERQGLVMGGDTYWGPYAHQAHAMHQSAALNDVWSLDGIYGAGGGNHHHHHSGSSSSGNGSRSSSPTRNHRLTIGRRLTHDLQTMQYTKKLYRMTPESILLLRGCSSDMRGVEFSPNWT